ncbi:MAG: winged helix-turn-helix domain-containing protein, partial [Acidobacteriota bacterium]
TKDALFRAGGFRIEDWVAKPALNQLIHADGVQQVNPKAMEVLVLLASRPGEVISRDEFLAAVWGETFVSDQVLANAIWELRRAFGDAPRSPRFIATVPKRGYRLLPPVLPVEPIGGEDRFDPDETASAGFGELVAAPPNPAEATDKPLPRTALIGGGAALLGALAGIALALTLALRGVGPAPAEDDALVVAILPFENSTGDDGLEWLVSAIPDVLNHELSSSRHLYVLDAFRPGAAADPGRDAAATAERRGAQVLVSGRVTGDADGLRVYGRYAPPGGDAAHFEVTAGEPAALFEALADRLRLALEVEAADEDGTAIAATGTSSIDAYRHYIQAIGLARRQDHGGAVAELHQALDADPSFALAHGELAHLYDIQGQDDLAMESVTRALELAAGRPQAQRVGLRRLRARIAGELGEELDALRQAVALRPRDARWIATLAWFQFTHFRQCEEAAVRYRRALELD